MFVDEEAESQKLRDFSANICSPKLSGGTGSGSRFFSLKAVF